MYKDKDKAREYDRLYKRRLRSRKRYVYNEYMREWRKKNKDHIHDYTIGLRIKLINFLGVMCVNCGYDSDVRGLCLDHINGGGNKDVKRFTNTRQMHKYYLQNIELVKPTLQVLCAICNQIKRHTNNEYTGHE